MRLQRQRPIAIVLVIALTGLILGTALGISTYRNYSCSKLCINYFSQSGNRAIKAKISYSGNALHNVVVGILINNAYRSTLKTDINSSLGFRPPLKLGFNLITVSYEASKSSVSFIYLGGLLYMLFIPLGILCLFMARLASFEFADRSGVTFYNNIDCPRLSIVVVRELVDSLIKMDKRITRGLPIPMTWLSRHLMWNSQPVEHNAMPKCLSYLSRKLNRLGVGFAAHGAVSNGPFPRKFAVASWLYEHLITSGATASIKGADLTGFLKENGVMLRDEISLLLLSKVASKHQRIRLVLLGDEEKRDVLRVMRSYSKIGAALLMLRVDDVLTINTLGS